MFKRLFFGKKKILLSFEYGVILSQVAKERGIEVTPELIKKAEEMLINECETQGPTFMAINMLPNIISAFELDLSK